LLGEFEWRAGRGGKGESMDWTKLTTEQRRRLQSCLKDVNLAEHLLKEDPSEANRENAEGWRALAKQLRKEYGLDNEE
jgi:hypothetical protein